MQAGAEVLFVDDADELRQYITTALRREGFNVAEAGSVVEAEGIIDAVADSEGARAIGAVILDGRFPFDDDRDVEAIESGDSLAGARAVVKRLKVRHLGTTVLGFSSFKLTREDIGLDDEDPVQFLDLGKEATKQEMVAALNALA